MSFETIEEFYELGMWSVGELEQLVKSGALTAAQFTQITGQAYPEPTPIKEIPVVSTPAPVKKIPIAPIESPKATIPTKSLLD